LLKPFKINNKNVKLSNHCKPKKKNFHVCKKE
jgi:hypothetical protein